MIGTTYPAVLEVKTVNQFWDKLVPDQFKNSQDAYWKNKNGYGVTKATT